MRVTLPASAAQAAFVSALTGGVATVRSPEPEPSAEVRREEDRRAMNDRVYRALFAAAREATARGEILDVLAWEREVVRTNEL
jgi:hypothetical protein